MTDVCVSGAGLAEFNGTYSQHVQKGGKLSFKKIDGDQTIWFNTLGKCCWSIGTRRFGDMCYSVKSNSDLPPEEGWTVSCNSGMKPAPVITVRRTVVQLSLESAGQDQDLEVQCMALSGSPLASLSLSLKSSTREARERIGAALGLNSLAVEILLPGGTILNYSNTPVGRKCQKMLPD